jgi:hypothetical protein
VVKDASITIPLAGTALDGEGNLSDGGLSLSLTSAIEALVHAARARRSL